MNSTISISPSKITLAILALSVSLSASSDELPFATYPAGSAHQPPIPNVILTVDDSGSMAWDDAGVSTNTSSLQRITKLKNGLNNVLVNTSEFNGRFRLAWQSMWRCNNIPSTQAACKGLNGMGEFIGGHKTAFKDWVTTLTASGGTPSHTMVWNAGEYLKTTGADSPWNATPGVSDTKPLTCRRSYHIFMTDGGWNTYLPDTSYTSFSFWDNMQTSKTDRVIRNADGTTKTLPDGTSYSTASNQTLAYRDTFGTDTTTSGSGSSKKTFAYPTLADMSFHYWANDLQPGILNEIPFEPKRSTNETFRSTDNSKTVTLTPYWNPRNDPANWQHMATYTIGYGSRASNWWNYGTNPQFTGGMYGAGLADLITGAKTWKDPITLNKPSNGPSNVAWEDYQRPEELWHMAINGRGKFYPVATGDELQTAFRDIFSSIVADNTSPITSFASNSSTNIRTDIGEFISGYAAKNWTGYVRSDSIATGTDIRSANVLWGVHSDRKEPFDRVTTADKLDDLSEANIVNRVILTANDTLANTTPQAAGVSFEWVTANESRLSNAQKTAIQAGGTTTVGQNRLNFLRGNRTLESDTVTTGFRVRGSRQGDIVNSNVWFVGAPSSNYSLSGYSAFSTKYRKRVPMIYVGGNDGMLHGFSAVDGSEKIAYVPKGVIRNLPALSGQTYEHKYYVDGSPFTGDVNWVKTLPPSGGTITETKENDWRTLLVGSLGAGGKGYFVLDVTNPGTVPDTQNPGATITSNFNTASAQSLVVLDNTWHRDDVVPASKADQLADIGYIFAPPVVDDDNAFKSAQIMQMNNGKWAAVMGNGYNSKNERPVLLIQYLDKASNDFSLKTIVATGGATIGANVTQNGLSSPRLVDLNSDGTPDIVYAGDLKGNLWKFDISSASDNEWGVSFNGSPLFSAVHTIGQSSTQQPITTVPIARANDRTMKKTVAGKETTVKVGGMMVAFGTGQSLTLADRTDEAGQAFYSVLDNTLYKLVDGKIKIDTAAATPSVVSRKSDLVEQTLTGNIVPGEGISSKFAFYNLTNNATDFSTKKGWFFTFPVTKERLLKNPSFYDGSNVLALFSQVPANGSNMAEETCAPAPQAEQQFFTLINIMDGVPPHPQLMDSNGDGIFNSLDKGVSRMSLPPGAISVAKTRGKIILSGGNGDRAELSAMPESSLRPSWRQVR